MGRMRDLARTIVGASKPPTVPHKPGAGHNGPPSEEEDRPGNLITMSRDARWHPIVGFDWSKPRTTFEAWYDLLCMAKYKPEEVISNGRKVMLNRGQLVGSRRWLADRWLWTEHQVRAWMADLERDGAVVWTQQEMLLDEGVNGHPRFRPADHPTDRPDVERSNHPILPPRRAGKVSVVNICNYSKYQLYSEAIEQFIATTNRPDLATTNRPEFRPENRPEFRPQELNTVSKLNRTPPYSPPPPGGDAVAHANGNGHAIATGHAVNGVAFALTGEDPVPAKRVRRRKTVGLHGLTPEQLDEAYLVLNGAYNYKPADRSEDRDQKLARRIEEIGGLGNFRRAICSIRFDDFFAGRLPARSPAKGPFKFTFDTLLSKQLGTNKVNVLMTLLDIAKERSANEESGDRPVTADEVEGWSDQRQEEEVWRALRGKSWLLGKFWRAPGHPDCRIRPHLIAKYRLTEIFESNGLRRASAKRVQDEVRAAVMGGQA